MKKKKKKKNKSRAKVFRYKKTGRSESEEKKREKSRRRTGESFYFYIFFSPPPAPAFGPSHIQKRSRAHIHADTRSHLLLSRLLSRLLALPSVVFLFSVQVEESKVKMNESQS